MLCASVLKVILSSFLCVFLTGEFQPKPSLLGDNSSSGQERDQFADGADALHSGFMNYIKVRWCGSTHISLLDTLEFRFKDFSPTFQSCFLFAPEASNMSVSIIGNLLQPCLSLDRTKLIYVFCLFCFLFQELLCSFSLTEPHKSTA